MRIVEQYSHLNGLEFLLVHKPNLWEEIQQVIAGIDAESCRTKVSKEKRTKDKMLFSPIDMIGEPEFEDFLNGAEVKQVEQVGDMFGYDFYDDEDGNA